MADKSKNEIRKASKQSSFSKGVIENECINPRAELFKHEILKIFYRIAQLEVNYILHEVGPTSYIYPMESLSRVRRIKNSTFLASNKGFKEFVRTRIAVENMHPSLAFTFFCFVTILNAFYKMPIIHFV